MFSVLPSGIVNVSVRLVPGSALCSTAIAISFFSLIVLLFSCCCGVCFDYDVADQERRRQARYIVVIPEAQAPEVHGNFARMSGQPHPLPVPSSTTCATESGVHRYGILTRQISPLQRHCALQQATHPHLHRCQASHLCGVIKNKPLPFEPNQN